MDNLTNFLQNLGHTYFFPEQNVFDVYEKELVKEMEKEMKNKAVLLNPFVIKTKKGDEIAILPAEETTVLYVALDRYPHLSFKKSFATRYALKSNQNLDGIIKQTAEKALKNFNDSVNKTKVSDFPNLEENGIWYSPTEDHRLFIWQGGYGIPERAGSMKQEFASQFTGYIQKRNLL